MICTKSEIVQCLKCTTIFYNVCKNTVKYNYSTNFKCSYKLY